MISTIACNSLIDLFSLENEKAKSKTLEMSND